MTSCSHHSLNSKAALFLGLEHSMGHIMLSNTMNRAQHAMSFMPQTDSEMHPCPWARSHVIRISEEILYSTCATLAQGINLPLHPGSAGSMVGQSCPAVVLVVRLGMARLHLPCPCQRSALLLDQHLTHVSQQVTPDLRLASLHLL